MTTPRSSQRIQSYKEERLRSARKALNDQVSFNKDIKNIQEIQSAIKVSLNRRSHQTLKSLKISQNIPLTQSVVVSPSTSQSKLRVSHANDKFICKYMNKQTNILQVSQQQPQALKNISNKILNRPLKNQINCQSKNLLSTRNTKITESRIQPKIIKKKITCKSPQVLGIIKKVQSLQIQILKLDLQNGKDISNEFKKIITKLEQC